MKDKQIIQSAKADLAERYQTDSDYSQGTVVMIGGEHEITIATWEGRHRLAGIISSDPAYVLNSMLEDSVVVALVGRVPCKVVGAIHKGDPLTISDIPGVATSTKNPEHGTIIGRALENYNSDSVGLIEVKVDRA